jgi:hypothetical protein
MVATSAASVRLNFSSLRAALILAYLASVMDDSSFHNLDELVALSPRYAAPDYLERTSAIFDYLHIVMETRHLLNTSGA